MIKTIPRKRNAKRQRRKRKIHSFECRVAIGAKRDEKAFLSDKCKEIEENNKM